LYSSAHPDIAIFIKNVLARYAVEFLHTSSADSYECGIIITQQKKITLYDGNIAKSNDFVKCLVLFNNV